MGICWFSGFVLLLVVCFFSSPDMEGHYLRTRIWGGHFCYIIPWYKVSGQENLWWKGKRTKFVFLSETYSCSNTDLFLSEETSWAGHSPEVPPLWTDVRNWVFNIWTLVDLLNYRILWNLLYSYYIHFILVTPKVLVCLQNSPEIKKLMYIRYEWGSRHN